MNAATWLYCLYSGEELVYVGITGQPRRRLREHKNRLRSVSRASWQRFPDRRSAATAEAALIRAEKPAHNRGVVGCDAKLVSRTATYRLEAVV